MYVAGIDAHATYLVVGVVSNAGDLVQPPRRIPNAHTDALLELLHRYQPIEAVVETSPPGRGSMNCSPDRASASSWPTPRGFGPSPSPTTRPMRSTLKSWPGCGWPG